MSKLIYVSGDDAQLLNTLMQSLRSHGYSLEYTTLSGATLSEPIHADVALLCTMAETNALLSIADVTLDTDNISAAGPDGPLHLTPMEFAMLSYLMKHASRAVPRSELLPQVWGFAHDSETRVADDTAKRLRRKLKDTHLLLETVWGYGFKVRPRETN